MLKILEIGNILSLAYGQVETNYRMSSIKIEFNVIISQRSNLMFILGSLKLVVYYVQLLVPLLNPF